MTAPNDPTLRQVCDELKADLKLDERVRNLEINHAASSTSIDALRTQVVGMETRLVAAIAENKPKSVWPAVSSIVAAIALILLVAERLYA